MSIKRDSTGTRYGCLTMNQTSNLRSDNLPEFLRVKEAVEWSRLGKGTLFGLMNRGIIRSISLRERGKIKGARLIVSDSLRDYLLGNVSPPPQQDQESQKV